MEVSIPQLRVFIAVAERGNFTRAADDLYMTQPSVSAVVAKLEQTVGQTLFEQIGKRIYLTQAGETMLDYAKRIVALSEEAATALDEGKEVGAGRLLMGASNTIGIYVLPKAMCGFKRAYPNLRVVVEIGNTAQIIARLLSNQLDFGLVAGHPEHADLQTRLFLQDRLVLILPASHPKARQCTMTLAELAEEPLIIRERGATTRTAIEVELARLGLVPKVTMELASNEAVKMAVAVGLGVSIVSELTLAAELALGSVAKLDLTGAQFRRDFYLVQHKDKYQTRTVREFLDYLVATVGAPPNVSAKE
ncbi:MAG: LysR family transcriptional regulator [Chloroflexi bacterium]|nr:LysR family transcriptional regulator [Chloroflexota bacterium]MCL5108006.1 LysR family transcriptional regulator [Chloroflexota bacterium]